MSDNAHNIESLHAEHDALVGEYATAYRVHSDTISAIPADASLRDMDARRDKALDITEAAQADQARVGEKLVQSAERAIEWATARTKADTTGLDALDGASLKRVYDRAIKSGDEARAIAAARMLDVDGDGGASLAGVSAAFPEVGTALGILDAYKVGPESVLGGLRYMAVRAPDDSRIAPTIEVAQRHAAEFRAAQQAELDAAIERKARQDHAARAPQRFPGSSVRSHGPRRQNPRTPFGH